MPRVVSVLLMSRCAQSGNMVGPRAGAGRQVLVVGTVLAEICGPLPIWPVPSELASMPSNWSPYSTMGNGGAIVNSQPLHREFGTGLLAGSGAVFVGWT